MDKTDEVKKLKQQLKDMEEAAKYWEKRYLNFYEQVDKGLSIIDKKLDWISEDYDLMINTITTILKSYEDNEVFSEARQRALNCVLQLDVNRKRREDYE